MMIDNDDRDSLQLEVATPTPRPFQAAAAMLLPGEVTATALLAAYLWRHLRQTVLLPGKCTVWRKWRHS